MRRGRRERGEIVMKTIVVYFTHFGKTRICAEAIAKELGADIREIKLKHERRGFLLYFLGGFEAMYGKKVELLEPNYDLAGYDTIILASPTWAGRQTPAIFTFAANANFSAKNVALFTVSYDKPEKVKNTVRPLIERSGGRFVGKVGVSIAGKKDEEIKEEAVKQIKGLWR